MEQNPGEILQKDSTVAERRERELAEEKLRQSEARYQALSRATVEGIAVTEHGRIIDVNDQFARMFGYEREEMLGLEVASLLPPYERDRVLNNILNNIESAIEHRALRKNGEILTVEAHARMMDYQGRLVRMTTIHDISERKRTEEALAEQARLLDLSYDAILVRDAKDRILYWNKGAEEIYGYSREEALGQIPSDLLDTEFPEPLDRIHEFLKREGKWAGELTHTRKDGSKIIVASRWAVDPDSDGNIRAVLETNNDITQRRQAEAAARGLERIYRAIGESIDYGVWVCTPDGRNIYASDSFLKLVGMTQEECSDFGWSGVLHPDDAQKTINAWKECIRTEGPWDIEHRFRAVNGHWRSILARGVPVRDEKGRITCWAGINLDISRLKQAEEDLRKANEELEERVLERTAALSNAIASLHEEVAQRMITEQDLRFRSEQLRFLASELTLAEQRERMRLAQVLHDGLQQILVGAKLRLASIEHGRAVRQEIPEVMDLLDDAMETSRSLTAELSPPILRQGGLLPALEWLARWMHDKHGLRVKLASSGKIGPLPEEITILLFQAARELLFNIVKHAGTKEADVEISRQDRRVCVIVEDKGAGFDTTKLHSEGGRSEGFGLLSIRERVSLLGGEFHIHSVPGQGSRCTLVTSLIAPDERLEATPDPAAGSAPKSAASDTLHSSGKKTRVVLVDDHMVMRQGLTGLLGELQDIEVAGEASDGESALRLIRLVRPDIVLMDISMPGMSGIQVTRIIHEEMPEIRIIGLSMFEEMEQSAAIREAGAVAYVTKSGPTADVVAAIRRHSRQNLVI
jgi:PAS domain S-box-containing protein